MKISQEMAKRVVTEQVVNVQLTFAEADSLGKVARLLVRSGHVFAGLHLHVNEREVLEKLAQLTEIEEAH